MEDMHIHLKKGVNDINIMREYAEKCIELEMKKVVFLDHGNRESKKHTPVLNTKEVIDKYFENIEIIKREYPNLEIKTGLESDFSYDKEFSKKEIDIINNYNFDVVIGSVHGMGKAEYKDYLKANKDMILNYPFDVIGHLKLRKEYEEYKKEIEEIVKLASERNVRFDLNTSDRSRWNIQQLEFMLGLFEKYKAEYSLGSDAHCIEEIGYGIKEMYIKIDKIKSNAERDIEYTIVSRGTEKYGSKGYMGISKVIDGNRLFLLSKHYDKYIDTYKDSFKIPKKFDVENIAFSRFELMSALTIRKIENMIKDNILIIGLGSLGFTCLFYLLKLGFKNIKILTRNVKEFQMEAIKLLEERFNVKLELTNEFEKNDTYIDATGNSEVIKNVFENANNGSNIILLGTPRDKEYFINPLDINRKSLAVFGGHELNGHTNEEREEILFELLNENDKEEFSKFINIYKSNKNVVEKILNKKENIIEVIKYDI